MPLGKSLIVMAMVPHRLNMDIVKLLKNGKKTIASGFYCWVAVVVVSFLIQKRSGIA